MFSLAARLSELCSIRRVRFSSRAESSSKSNNGSRFRIKTILVPVDFSSCSREGLRYAIAFANEFGAKIILLHATYLGYVYSSEGTAIYDIPGLQKAAGKLPSAKCESSCGP